MPEQVEISELVVNGETVLHLVERERVDGKTGKRASALCVDKLNSQSVPVYVIVDLSEATGLTEMVTLYYASLDMTNHPKFKKGIAIIPRRFQAIASIARGVAALLRSDITVTENFERAIDYINAQPL